MVDSDDETERRRSGRRRELPGEEDPGDIEEAALEGPPEGLESPPGDPALLSPPVGPSVESGCGQSTSASGGAILALAVVAVPISVRRRARATAS